VGWGCYRGFEALEWYGSAFSSSTCLAPRVLADIAPPPPRGWKAVSAFIIICSAHVHWFVLQPKLISIQSIVVLMMR
jgi:hypothetical protein